MDFRSAKVEKGAFVARVKTDGYRDVIHGEFSSPTKVSGTLRSVWTPTPGNPSDCDSGKVRWSAKFSSPLRG